MPRAVPSTTAPTSLADASAKMQVGLVSMGLGVCATALVAGWRVLHHHQPRRPLAPTAFTALTVVGEPFDSEEERVEAIRRTYLSPEVFVLDVRGPDEVAETGTLRKAVNIPHTAVAQSADQLPPFRDVPILVFCKMGHRSGIAAQILAEMGYLNIINAGGYNDLKYLDLYALYRDPRTTVLDVRTPEEVAAGTLRRARNIEYQDVGRASLDGLLPPSPTAPIMVFCKAGKRAAMAEQSLRALGYTDVTNAGGYHDIQSFDH